MYDKLLKVKCEIAREGKTPGNYRHKRSLHSFQLLLLVHKICIEKIGQMIWEIILVSRPGRVNQLWFREWQEVPLLSFSLQWDKHPLGKKNKLLSSRHSWKLIAARTGTEYLSIPGLGTGIHLGPRFTGRSGAGSMRRFHFQDPGTRCLSNQNKKHTPTPNTWPTSVEWLILIWFPIYRWETKDREIKWVAQKSHSQ